MSERCPWAIRFGGISTRCMRRPHVAVGLRDRRHEARGLAKFPDQKVVWYASDQREYRSERGDDFAWEELEPHG